MAANEELDDRRTRVAIEIPQALHLPFGQPQSWQLTIFLFDALDDAREITLIEHVFGHSARCVIRHVSA
jgi:hypothetical protein